MARYRCHRCGELHQMMFAFHAPTPEQYLRIPESDRAKRAVLSEETCEIDGKNYFLRGLVQIPVKDGPEPFQWGVWVSVGELPYRRALDIWLEEGREKEPAYPGALATELPDYPPTTGLKVMVHTRPVGQRPLLEVAAADHPLAVERRDGVTMTRVREINEFFVHGPIEKPAEPPPAAEPIPPAAPIEPQATKSPLKKSSRGASGRYRRTMGH
ncbi:MAG: DUF2199 domain-containing protein [Planctomycetes bacterium]|nr:DUF2199 domain-containing protein [Planctomycetota bacterium]